MELAKSKKMLQIVFFKATTFIKHKIHNFDFKSLYAYTLAYKEFLKLGTLSKKQW